MKAYSTDLRQKIIEAYQQDHGIQRAVAEFFGVSVSFVEKLLQRYRTTGNIAAKPHGDGQKRRLDAAADQHILAGYRQPDLTLAQLQSKTRQELGVSLSLATLCRNLKRLGLTRKKSIRACEQDSERVRQAHPTLPHPDRPDSIRALDVC